MENIIINKDIFRRAFKSKLTLFFLLMWIGFVFVFVIADIGSTDLFKGRFSRGILYAVILLGGILGIVFIRLQIHLYLRQIEHQDELLQQREKLMVKTNEKLIQQTRFLKLVTDSFSHPFFVVDAERFHIIMANKAFYSHHNLPDDYQFKGEKCYELSHQFNHPCNSKDHPCPLLEAKETRKPVSMQHIHKNSSGEDRIVEITAFPVIDEKTDKVRQVLEYNIDITEKVQERKKYEEHLLNLNQLLKEKSDALEELNISLEDRIRKEVEASMQKDRMLTLQSRQAAMGEMIGNIAHQWRQPLNTINLIIFDLLEAHKHGEMDADYLNNSYQQINQVVQNMSQTIDDFRNFFKPNKEKKVFDVNEIIKKSLLLTKPLIAELKIKVNLVKKGKLMVLGYPNELMQTIVNIINNAGDALSESAVENRMIDIQSSREDDRIVISISNNGGNISEKDMEKIFEPYFSTKPEGQGMGLGLFIAKTIVEKNMDGRFSVSNTYDGVCFKIELSGYQG